MRKTITRKGSKVKIKRGQKLCKTCNTINGVRSFFCKNCDAEFKMKKARRGIRKKRIEDYKTLTRGDIIKVVGGSGPYYLDKKGDKHYFVDRGKYTVQSTDSQGIRVYGKHGYGYLYMGKKCKSDLLDSIIKVPCKIVLLNKPKVK